MAEKSLAKGESLNLKKKKENGNKVDFGYPLCHPNCFNCIWTFKIEGKKKGEISQKIK